MRDSGPVSSQNVTQLQVYGSFEKKTGSYGTMQRSWKSCLNFDAAGKSFETKMLAKQIDQIKPHLQE